MIKKRDMARVNRKTVNPDELNAKQEQYIATRKIYEGNY